MKNQMKLYRIWYKTFDGEYDFTECNAIKEADARRWFKLYHDNYIDTVEVADYSLLCE